MQWGFLYESDSEIAIVFTLKSENTGNLKK